MTSGFKRIERTVRTAVAETPYRIVTQTVNLSGVSVKRVGVKKFKSALLGKQGARIF